MICALTVTYCAMTKKAKKQKKLSHGLKQRLLPSTCVRFSFFLPLLFSIGSFSLLTLEELEVGIIKSTAVLLVISRAF